MGHNWIPSQTFVMHMRFHWGKSNSFTEESVVATISHIEKQRNTRTEFTEGAFKVLVMCEMT